MGDRIEIKLTDPQDEGLRKLSNLLDPLSWETFVSLVKDPKEKRSLSELIKNLLEGN